MHFQKKITNKGFTLIEVLIVVALLTSLIGMSISMVNWEQQAAQNTSNELASKFADIESAFNQYTADKNTQPTGLTDTTFTPIYLFTPHAPKGFDAAYGTNGFVLAHQTGQASPNNGWHICSKVTVTGANDSKYIALKNLSTSLSLQKYFYNTACPSNSNMADPGGAATIYSVYWITRD